jgi:CheY-like chemotaxis protein
MRALRTTFNDFFVRNDIIWEGLMGALVIVWLVANDQPPAPVSDFLTVSITVVFAVEFALRFASSFDRLAYFKGHLIDLVTLIPALRGFRLLRLLGLLRHIRQTRGLANQIGVALQLLDQRSVREQLFRSEKLAAVGRLISGVINELQTPLASICRHAQATLSLAGETRLSRELRAIRSEGQKASDIVARLVSFGKTDHVEATPLDVNQLLQELLEFREREWKARGIRVQTLLANQPLFTRGSRGQLEQVFLSLLVHAEQSVTDSAEKMVTVRTSLLAQRILIEISYSVGSDTANTWEKLSHGPEGILDVLRGIMAGHSGELRLVNAEGADPRFEVELPALNREQRQGTVKGTPPVQRSVTALVIEPDEAVQRHLVSSLGARGFRVIPTENADSGLDLAHRLRFDLAFCSFHAPGLNWVELSEQLQGRVGAFVLMPDGYDAELAADFEGDGRFVLPKPIDEDNLDLVLQLIERTLIG